MNDLINSLNELEEVKRYKKLEKIIDEKKEYKEKLSILYGYQKQMVNSKHNNLENNYYIFSEKYNKLKKELEEDIIIDMYLTSLNDVTEILDSVTSVIKKRIDDSLMK